MVLASASCTASSRLDRLVFVLLLFSVLLSGGFIADTVAQKLQKVFIDDITLSIEPNSEVVGDTNVILICRANIRAFGQEGLIYGEYTIYKNNNPIYTKTSKTSQDLLYMLPPILVSNSGSYCCSINIQGEQKRSRQEKLTVTALQEPILHLDKSVVMEGEELTATCTAPGRTGKNRFVLYDYSNIICIMENYSKAEIKFRLNGKGFHWIECSYSVSLGTISYRSDYSNFLKVLVKELPFTLVLEIAPQSGIYVGNEFFISCTVGNSSKDPYLNSEEPILNLYQGDNLLATGATKLNHSMVALASGLQEFECELEMGKIKKTTTKMVPVLVPAPREILLHLDKSVVMEGEELTAMCTSTGETVSIVFYFYDGTKVIDMVENSYKAELKFRLNGKGIHWIHCFFSFTIGTKPLFSEESNSIMVQVKELPYTLVLEIAPHSKIYVGEEFFISCTVGNSSKDPYLNSEEPLLLLYQGNNLLARGATKLNHSMVALASGLQEFECELEIGKIKKTTTKTVPVSVLQKPILHLDKSVVMEGEELTATCTAPGWTGNNRFALYDNSKIICIMENYSKAEIKFRLNGKGFHWIDCSYSVSLGTIPYHSDYSNFLMVQVKELPFTLVLEITPQSEIYVGNEFFISCTVGNRSKDTYLNSEEPSLNLYQGDNLLATGATKLNHSMVALASGLQEFECELEMGKIKKTTTKMVPVLVPALREIFLHLDKSVVMEGEELTAMCSTTGETVSIVFYFYDGTKVIDRAENSYNAELKFRLNGKGIHWIHCAFSFTIGTKLYIFEESNSLMVQVNELPFKLVLEIAPHSKIYVGDELFISCTVGNNSKDPYLNSEEPILLLYQGNNLLARGATKVNHSMIALASGLQGFKCELEIGKIKKTTTKTVPVSALPKPILHLDKSVVMEGEELTATCMVPGKTGSMLYYFYDGIKMINMVENSYNAELKFRLNSKGIHWIHCKYRVGATKTFYSYESNPVMVEVKELPFTLVMEITRQSKIYVGDEFFISCTVSNSSEDPYLNSEEPILLLYQGNNLLARGATKVNHSMVGLASGSQGLQCEFRIGYVQIKTTKRIWVSALPKPFLHLDKSVVMEGEELTARCTAPGKTDFLLFYFYDGTKEIAKEQVNSNQAELKFHLHSKGTHKIHCDYNIIVGGDSLKSNESNSVMVPVKELLAPVLEVTPQSTIFEGDEFFISCTVSSSSEDPPLSSGDPTLYLYQGTKELARGATKLNHSMVALARDPQELECELEMGKIKKTTTKMVPVLVSVSTPKISAVGPVVVGRPFQILCQSDAGSLPINYTLMEVYKLLRTVSVERSSDQALFTVNVSRPEQIKRYRCEAKNSFRAGKLSERLSADVIEPLTESTLIGGSKFPNLPEVSEGDHLHLVCSVKGTPPVTFRWYRVGSELPLYTTTSSDTNATYQIPALSKHHSGTYYCEAANQANNVVRSPQVVIEVNLALWKKGVIGGAIGGVCLVALVVLVVLLVLHFRSNRGTEPYNPLIFMKVSMNIMGLFPPQKFTEMWRKEGGNAADYANRREEQTT